MVAVVKASVAQKRKKQNKLRQNAVKYLFMLNFV